VLAAIFASYVILGILYESFIHPITIISGLPSAGVGALITLIAWKMDLSVIELPAPCVRRAQRGLPFFDCSGFGSPNKARATAGMSSARSCARSAKMMVMRAPPSGIGDHARAHPCPAFRCRGDWLDGQPEGRPSAELLLVLVGNPSTAVAAL
jgi:hypothetical protein